MKKTLYLDISDETAGGSLYRITAEDGEYFYYQHSTYDSDQDHIQVFESRFMSFAAFWEYLTRNEQWFYLHPLFIHPEQRDFISRQLQGVNWAVGGNAKWQESHRRQWKKALTDPAGYYRGPL